jgi:hypothetical protein
MVNRQKIPHDYIFKRMNAKVVWKLKGFDRLGHCVAWDPNRSFWWRKELKYIFSATNGERNGLRITLGERPLW